MNKNIVYGAIAITFIVAVLALVVGIGGTAKHNVGAITTNLASLGLADLSVGSGCDSSYSSCTGSDLTKMLTGTCNLFGTSDALVAYTPKVASCLATGVRSGDKIFVSLASTTNAGMVSVLATAASSSNDYIAVVLDSATTTVTSITAVGTSTQYWVIR